MPCFIQVYLHNFFLLKGCCHEIGCSCKLPEVTMTVYLQVDVACRVLYKRHVKKGHWQSFLLQVFLESFLLQVPSLKIKKIKSCKARQGQIHEIKIGAGCEDEVIFYLEPMVDFRCKSMGVYFPFLPPFSFLLSSSLPRFHHSWLKIVWGLRRLSSHARSASASSLSHSSSMIHGV